MLGISIRAQNCHASATLAITAKAAALKKEGKDVVGFGAGEPDFEPPEIIIKSMLAAVAQKGSARYTAAAGLPELKQVVVDKFKKDNGLIFTPKNISINVGAKHSIYNILQTIVNPGDEVIFSKPFWVSYPEMISLAGGVSVIVNTDAQYVLHAAAVEKAITPKTKAIIINSPSNPTGAVIPAEELKKIAELAIKHNIYIISDEIYEKIIYGQKHVSIASFSDAIKAQTFVVNGMSKSHAITGWRLGFIAGPEAEITALNNIQSHSTSNPTSIVQLAAIPSLNQVDDFIAKAVIEYQKRRDYLVGELNAIKGVSCPMPGGAFYVFPKIPVTDDMQFSKDLLEQKLVAVVPGAEFGMPGYIRLSYATSMENIKKGVARLKEFIEK